MKYAIIILNYNSFQDTRQILIDSLLSLDSSDSRIIIVDNASSNRTGEKELLDIIDPLPNISYIANDKNSGYAQGNNIGLQKAHREGYEYAFIINPDIRIPDNAIFNELINEMQNTPNCALLGVNIDNITPYYSRPSILSFIFPPYLRAKDKIIHSVKKKFDSPNTPLEVYRIYGCFMLIDLTVFSKIGMFDSSTFLYGEESIVAEKLLSNLYKTYYSPQHTVSHFTNGSSNMLKNKMFPYIYESDVIYLSKYRKMNLILAKGIAFNSIIYRIVMEKVIRKII